ncbi:hypothetical protein [Niabella ginsengisoli]|uniref:Uncharacterized protein n=1 Tax=Niabella ginsengisoli TaxID=522298 RepID=A0ABS9SKG7_9BACT|nr:hypothetical protein [Niabella ginsengisoli]MCH5598845.1 hypothetical protein [Niabella ginsengisoli]
MLKDGSLSRYRCHTGHAYSTDSLLASVTESIEDNLWNVIRGIEESIMMLNNTGDHHAEQNDPKLAAQYFQKAKEAGDRLQVLKDMVAINEPLSMERISGDGS